MMIKVNNIELNLKDSICRDFKEKILYDITANECEMYAETTFNDSFSEIVKAYPIDIIEKAIEKAMLEEINL